VHSQRDNTRLSTAACYFLEHFIIFSLLRLALVCHNFCLFSLPPAVTRRRLFVGKTKLIEGVFGNGAYVGYISRPCTAVMLFLMSNAFVRFAHLAKLTMPDNFYCLLGKLFKTVCSVNILYKFSIYPAFQPPLSVCHLS